MTYCVIDYLVTLFFVKRYLRQYNRSEVETLHVGAVRRDTDAAYSHN